MLVYKAKNFRIKQLDREAAMSRKSQHLKAITKRCQRVGKKVLSAINKQIIWLLRTISSTRKRRETSNAGFVLPTVVMVSIVVILLTAAVLFRSFQRAQNASNVRINEVVLQAASPALDRARAKLDKLFDDRRLPRATPSDTALEEIFKNYLTEYTFGDETPLKLSYESSNDLPSAWMFPIDTNNNGKFDAYTLYAIYFRNPPTKSGKYERARNPLEARTPPMTSGNVGSGCDDTFGTSATLVGSTGWFNIAGKLRKSFFVYTANVPITSKPADDQYEIYQGNKGFSGLEFQQERVQLPLVNNAVVYEDDIALNPGPKFNLNGRILTNSNFLTASGSNVIDLYQVSSPKSCFYDDDNAKIIIGGNLAAGGFTSTGDLGNATKVHLYQGKGVKPTTTSDVTSNKSAKGAPKDIAYNSLAYVQRINLLVDAQLLKDKTTDPKEVQEGITEEKKKAVGTVNEKIIRRKQLELYFKKRTRRVPYAEVSFQDAIDGKAIGSYNTSNVLKGSGESLRPQDDWVFPFKPTDGKTQSGYANVELNSSGTKLLPGATEPTKQVTVGKEQYVGDRALVGNNLPQFWWDDSKNRFVGTEAEDTQVISGYVWDDGNGTRTRRTRVQQLADLGTIDRDGDWELAAAELPLTPQDGKGGVRIITGAGIYLPQSLSTSSAKADFDAAATATDRIWSDMMPVPIESMTINGSKEIGSARDTKVILPNSNTPYLRMRATAVYHYAASGYNKDSPKPIACVSSYYDPTNSSTAKNLTALPDIAPTASATEKFPFPYRNDPASPDSNARSHNGIVYGPPNKALSDYKDLLEYQAKLKYPNGRWVNEILKNALENTGSRTLAQQSAIDTALCAIQILDGTIKDPDNSIIPHGAIYETAFLDARQVKAVHADNTTPGVANDPKLGVETFTNADGDGSVKAAPDVARYGLRKETRQPLEIRATVLDIDRLRNTKFASGISGWPQEYLIPNSGIIYASRNDALLDLSTASGIAAADSIDVIQEKAEKQKSLSSVDFILDPTRRPNAIMLVNGEKIWRTETYRDEEKGLILASNLPVYIKGDLNKHSQEEFTQTLTTDTSGNWSNFYDRSTLNKSFACRKGDPRISCPDGDQWRTASVLADAITLLSGNYREGYRNEGDYDLNNNLGNNASILKARSNGYTYLIRGSTTVYDTNNANAINADWYDPSSGFPKDFDSSKNLTQGSSYLNNFVTPIQRRASAPEYLMEFCLKLPISECGVNDWVVNDSLLKASDITDGTNFNPAIHQAGTTARLPELKFRRFPRRVAFRRGTSAFPADRGSNRGLTNGEVGTDLSGNPTIIGIKSINNIDTIKYFPLASYSSTNRPDTKSNALWFRTTSDTDPTAKPLFIVSTTATDQPTLSPVLQIQTIRSLPSGTATTKDDDSTQYGPGSGNQATGHWLPIAVETTFNLAAAAGDTPARPEEDNGGLHNFVRFVENWNVDPNLNKATAAKISGSFIQIKRSNYATGPFVAFLTADTLNTGNNFKYPIANFGNVTSFYLAPLRQWGYDVGLLSQSPDLFAQKLALTPDEKPDEYFREVGRDDPWMQVLLCAKKASDGKPAIDTSQRPSCS